MAPSTEDLLRELETVVFRHLSYFIISSHLRPRRGVLSGGAVARIASSPIEMMTITDSILATEAVRVADNVRQITIAPLMAEAMRRINDEGSVSSLFD